jgi:hypothetical protein
MQNINEITWGNQGRRQYETEYPSPDQISRRMGPKMPALIPSTPNTIHTKYLTYPGDRYDPPFDFEGIVAQTEGHRNDSIAARLKELQDDLSLAGIKIIGLVADQGGETDDNTRYNFNIAFSGFIGYYNWADEWIGSIIERDDEEVYGRGIADLLKVR